MLAWFVVDLLTPSTYVSAVGPFMAEACPRGTLSKICHILYRQVSTPYFQGALRGSRKGYAYYNSRCDTILVESIHFIVGSLSNNEGQMPSTHQ